MSLSLCVTFKAESLYSICTVTVAFKKSVNPTIPAIPDISSADGIEITDIWKCISPATKASSEEIEVGNTVLVIETSDKDSSELIDPETTVIFIPETSETAASDNTVDEEILSLIAVIEETATADEIESKLALRCVSSAPNASAVEIAETEIFVIILEPAETSSAE